MEIVGLGIFSIIKYGGYFLFFKFACPRENAPNIYLVALIRLVAGLVVGFSIHFAFSTGREIFPVYFSAILVGRLILWFVILSVFYTSLSLREKIMLTVGGTLVSYILDIPAAMGLWVTVGGIY